MTRLRRSHNWRHTRRTRRQGTEEEDEAGEEQEQNQIDKGRTRKRTGNRYRIKKEQLETEKDSPKVYKGGKNRVHREPRPSKSILEEERKAMAH